MNHSEEICDVIKAIRGVQQDVKSIPFDCVNSYYKNGYASLPAIWKELKPALEKYELTVIFGGNLTSTAECLDLTITVAHASGQWWSESATFPYLAHDPQKAAAAMSYGKRMLFSSVFLLITESDDDGNSAAGNTERKESSGKLTPVDKSTSNSIKAVQESLQKAKEKPLTESKKPEEATKAAAAPKPDVPSKERCEKARKLMLDAIVARNNNAKPEKDCKLFVDNILETARSYMATGQIDDHDFEVLEDWTKEALLNWTLK